MQLFIAIFLGKLIALLSKTFKLGGGSAAPGLYALKIDPDLVLKLTQKIPKNVVITGTNGKTTTARILAHFAKESGLKVIRNHTGSNLERGIASALIHNSSFITHNSKFDLGIWELDEAAFNTVAPKVKPNSIVFLNVFRDQLDRYGEVNSVVKKWRETLSKIDPKTKILVNGDDDNTAKLASYFKGQIQKFGLENYKLRGESIKKSKHSQNLDFEAKNIKTKGLNGSAFNITIYDIRYTIRLPLPGIYHIYDFLAAFGAGLSLNLNPGQMANSVKSFSPAFGRVEKLPFGYIFLIKNPAGATQVFETIAPQIKQNDRLFLLLNDNLADGADVSWIWDAEFEKLKVQSSKLKVICSGERAYDLANRLKYAGFDTNHIFVEADIKKAFKQAQQDLKGRLFILPTYTAMLELQSILTKSGIKKNYWESD